MNYLYHNVSILLPFKTDNGPREKAFKWVKQYYQETIPNGEICIGTCNNSFFSKSIAVNNAAKIATRDIFIIIDSDMFCDPTLIARSLKLLNKYPWVIPYKNVHYLSQDTTMRVIAEPPNWPLKIDISENITKMSDAFGGINIVPRKYFEEVGGFDERFKGWGGEDDAFCFALNTMVGKFKRLDSAIYHLWHPHVGAKNNPNYENNNKLYEKYLKNIYNKEAMIKLIKGS